MSFRLLATIEFGKQAIGDRNQIIVLRQVVRGQSHPTREFRYELRPIPIRERLKFVEQLLRGLHHESESHFVFFASSLSVIPRHNTD